jgi:thiol-disulfide isomerase/thioredoxin
MLVMFWLILLNFNLYNKKVGNAKAVTITQSEEIPQIHKMAPSFNLTGLDGRKYSLNSIKGTPLVINFWASWCGPCKMEAPELVKLHQKYGDKIEIYAINVTKSDSISGVHRFADEFGIEFPVLLDKDDEVSTKYRIVAIPTTFFVNKDGKIVDMIAGFGGAEVLAEKFERLSLQ